MHSAFFHLLPKELGFHSAFFSERTVQGRRTEGLIGRVHEEVDSDGKPRFLSHQRSCPLNPHFPMRTVWKTGPERTLQKRVQCLIFWFSRKQSLRERVNTLVQLRSQGSQSEGKWKQVRKGGKQIQSITLPSWPQLHQETPGCLLSHGRCF